MLLHTLVCGCNGCCAWLWLWTGWLTLHILLIWHHLTIFCSPTWKNTWLGSSIGQMMKSYLQLRTFSKIRMRTSIPRESKHCSTDKHDKGRMWTAGEAMLKIKPHFGQIRPWHHSQPMNFSAHPRNWGHIQGGQKRMQHFRSIISRKRGTEWKSCVQSVAVFLRQCHFQYLPFYLKSHNFVPNIFHCLASPGKLSALAF